MYINFNNNDDYFITLQTVRICTNRITKKTIILKHLPFDVTDKNICHWTQIRHKVNRSVR